MYARVRSCVYTNTLKRVWKKYFQSVLDSFFTGSSIVTQVWRERSEKKEIPFPFLTMRICIWHFSKIRTLYFFSDLNNRRKLLFLMLPILKWNKLVIYNSAEWKIKNDRVHLYNIKHFYIEFFIYKIILQFWIIIPFRYSMHFYYYLFPCKLKKIDIIYVNKVLLKREIRFICTGIFQITFYLFFIGQ